MTGRAEDEQAKADAHSAKAEEYRSTDAPSNEAAAGYHEDKAAQHQTAANIYKHLDSGGDKGGNDNSGNW
jgi:hypothetical protein